jgi:RimJ/RimL family protein N-acetyltransferase
LSSTTGQPIGPLVDAHPAPRPNRPTLKGRWVTLVRLKAEHSPSLYDLTKGAANDSLWTYLFNGPFASFEAFEVDVAAKAKADDPHFFAVIDNTTGRAVGYQSLMRIDPANRVIEVGGIMYTPALQRTVGATEAHFLFMRHVFDDLGYRRYEWKCNDLNAPSKRAAVRLGFTFEGVFRQHMIIKGRNRDTAWFSILDTEWPVRKAMFERWLAPENFDAEGSQKAPLSNVSLVPA